MKTFLCIFLCLGLMVSCGPSPCQQRAQKLKEEKLKAATDSINNAQVKIEAEPKEILYSKYHVSDIVCAWEKFSGVVTSVERSDTDPNVIKYNVEYLNPEGTEFIRNYFYDTELQRGKCN